MLPGVANHAHRFHNARERNADVSELTDQRELEEILPIEQVVDLYRGMRSTEAPASSTAASTYAFRVRYSVRNSPLSGCSATPARGTCADAGTCGWTNARKQGHNSTS